MRIYTSQPQVVVGQADDHGLVAVEFTETNLFLVLPFWGWYITDGRNEKPDNSYRFDLGDQNRDANA